MLHQFANVLLSASDREILADPTLSGRLVLARKGSLTISYAPFEAMHRQAKLAIVGLTPGRYQAAAALIEARHQLNNGASYEEAAAAAKQTASFSGPMRANLTAMLDRIGLPQWLGMEAAAEIFDRRAELVHFTSAIRYPVFINGANYSGTPRPLTQPLLLMAIERWLAEEAEALVGACWLPLGRGAQEALDHLVGRRGLSESRVLTGFPHPSGANAERIAYFLGRKSRDNLSSRTNAEALDAQLARLCRKVKALS